MRQDEFISMRHNSEAPSDSSLPADEANRKRIEPARIEELPSFTLAGISTVTTNATELSGKGKIGQLFEHFHALNISELLAPISSSMAILAVTSIMNKALPDNMK